MASKHKDQRAIGLLCLMLGIAGAARVAAQVLNPGFETPGATAADALNWTVTQATGGPVYAVRTNSHPRNGAFNFEVRLASVGAGPVVAFSQANVPVTGGATYPFTFHAKALTGSAGHNPQWRVVWNAGGDTGFHTFTAGNNVYAFVSNIVTAPVAATSATLSFYCAGAAATNMSATLEFDDVSLGTATGGSDGVGTNQSFTITVSPAVRISWFASNSITYQVQWASDLNSNPVWNDLGSPLPGQGSSNSVVDPFGPPHNFYQVLSIH
jgi:hypothetical protein